MIFLVVKFLPLLNTFQLVLLQQLQEIFLAGLANTEYFFVLYHYLQLQVV